MTPQASYRLSENHPLNLALCDTPNTPEAISERHHTTAALNKTGDADKPHLKAELLGPLTHEPSAWFQQGSGDSDLSSDAIDALITERTEAKKARGFARANAIRQQLDEAGIVLEDTREGTRWSRK